MFKPKMVVTDVDGTLLTSRKRLTSKTRNYLLELQKSGVKLVLNSGRDLLMMKKLAHLLQMDTYDGYLVFSNGYGVYSCKTKELVTAQEHIRPETAKALCQLAITNQCYTDFLTRDYVYQYVPSRLFYFKMINYYLRNQQKKYDPTAQGSYVRAIKSFEDIQGAIYKISVSIFRKNAELLYDRLKEHIEDMDNVSIVKVTNRWFDIMPKNISKGQGIQTVSEMSGIALEEMMVFGDAENDISMFEVVKHSVAMGDAMSNLKAVAAFTTHSSDDEGIYHYLKTIYGHIS